jgi:hypothetical protein
VNRAASSAQKGQDVAGHAARLATSPTGGMTRLNHCLTCPHPMPLRSFLLAAELDIVGRATAHKR